MRKHFYLGALICFLLAGCGQSAQQQIIGKWQKADGSGIIEFHSSGDISLAEGVGKTATGKYEFLDSNTLKIQASTSVSSDTSINTVQVSEDSLTLTGPDGTTAKYKRVE
jgi:hypothetical protein